MIRLKIYIPALTLFFSWLALFASVEDPPIAILEHDSIHCEIGHNFDGGTRGVIHLWKKHVPGAVNSYDEPFDVMFWGEYDYVKIDNNWFVEAGENPAANKLFGIKDNSYELTDSTCILNFPKAQFEVTKEIQPLIKKINGTNQRLPVIKVTYTIKNNTAQSHSYSIYHADDYSLGGLKRPYINDYKDETYAYKKGVYDSLAVSQLVSGRTSNCIISKLNCKAPTGKQFFTFLGIADTSAQFYIANYTKVVARQFVVNENILDDPAISIGIRYDIGTLAPGQSKNVWFYLGTSQSWSGINSLADQVLGSSTVDVSIQPNSLTLPENEKNYQTVLQLKNNSDLNIRLNNVSVLPGNPDFVNLTYLNGTAFPGGQGLDLAPFASAFCRLNVQQPDYYKNTLTLKFNYDAEGGSSGSVAVTASMNRQAPKTSGFMLKGGAKDGTVEYTDKYLIIDGRVDDSQTGASFLDSCSYFDNSTEPSARISSFGLENISYSFTDWAVAMPGNWEPGSTHKVYFHSKDKSGLAGRFYVAGEYDSLLVNVRPQVKSIQPSGGEYKDPVPLLINAGIYDSLKIQWTDNLNNAVWQPVYSGTAAGYSWNSALNSSAVWLRAQVRKGDLFSAWLNNSASFMIDNQPPYTTADGNNNPFWQKIPVTVTLSRSDSLSGFDSNGKTYYSLDGSGSFNTLPPPHKITVNYNFNDFISYYSVDDVGNSEVVKKLKVKVDLTSPVIEKLEFDDLTSADTSACRFKFKIADRFSGLKKDSVLLSWRYGSLEWQSRFITASDSIYTDSIAAPADDWLPYMNSYLQLSVTALDSAGNRQYLSHDELIQYKNQPPAFKNPISDQTVLKMQNFTDLDLRNYVSDELPQLITWQLDHSNSSGFNISLTNGYLFKITPVNPLVTGSDTVIFKMIDQENAFATDTAVFTIQNYNYPPVISGLTGQSVAFNSPFAAFDLDDFAADADHSDAELSWSTNAVSPLKITIDPFTHLCTVITVSTPGVPDNSIAIAQAVTFLVKDPLNATAAKTVTFRRGDYPVTVLEIDNQTVNEDEKFRAFKLSDFVISTDPVSWNFAFSGDSLNYFTADPAGKFTLNHTGSDSCHIICKADSSGRIFVRFRAQDSNGFKDSTVAGFRVNPVNDSPVFTGVAGQTIAHQAAFTPFNLRRLVADKETPAGPFVFSALSSPVFDVTITDINADSVMAMVWNSTPDYNGGLSDSLTFIVSDAQGGSGSARFSFTVNPDTLQLQLADQAIDLGSQFAGYLLNSVVRNFVLSPADLRWSFSHFSGDSVAELSLDGQNGRLNATARPGRFGQEKILVSVTDSVMQQQAVDTVAFKIHYQNQPPLLTVEPDGILSINQGVQCFSTRTITRTDDLTPAGSLALSWSWHSSPVAPVFELDTLAIIQDSLKVRVLSGAEWSGSDTLSMILKDQSGLADTVQTIYRVNPVNAVPVLAAFPDYDLTGMSARIVYLDKYVSDADNQDGEINWTFENSSYLNFDSTGSSQDSGRYVVVRVINPFTGTKAVSFTAADPQGALASSNVNFRIGISLPYLQICDSNNTDPLLAGKFLNDLFARAKFPFMADSARVGLSMDPGSQPWQAMRSDSSIIFDFSLSKAVADYTPLKFYGQIQKEGLVSLIARDSIYFDNQPPQGSFYLESLTGSVQSTLNDTVRIKSLETAADVYRYAYSRTQNPSQLLYEDSLRQKFVLDDSGWLYITFLDSAGNTYTAADNIDSPPEIVVVEPDLVKLKASGDYYPHASLTISGYDRTGTADTIMVKYRNQKISLSGTDLSGDRKNFQTRMRLADSGLDTVEIEAVKANGTRSRLAFAVRFQQKRHFVLTLNGDGYNDFCYFETGNDPAAEVSIFSLRGDLISSLRYDTARSEPPRFEGKDQNGRTLPGGLYLFVVKTREGETSGSIAIVR